MTGIESHRVANSELDDMAEPWVEQKIACTALLGVFVFPVALSKSRIWKPTFFLVALNVNQSFLNQSASDSVWQSF